jgi:hypothetical protein
MSYMLHRVQAVFTVKDVHSADLVIMYCMSGTPENWLVFTKGFYK